MNKRSVFLILFLSASVFVSACALQTIRERETDAPEITTTESRQETTVAPTPEPTSTPKPTSRPTSTPAPTPTTVYIPPETLPDGQLFEDKYYLILPGEGAIYNVFDCKGEIVETYHALAYGSTGLFEKEQVEQIILYAEKSTSDSFEYDPETGVVTYKETFPGGYLQCTFADENEYGRIVTGKETIRILRDDPDAYLSGYGTSPLSGYTGVLVTVCHYSGTYYSYDVFYAQIKKDGTVISRRSVENLPGFPVQFPGEDLVIIGKYAPGGSDSYDLTDLYGNILLENVDPIPENMVVGVSFFEYYLKKGIAYDTSLKPVPADTLTADGHLIPGVTYHVEGIPCSVLNETNYSGGAVWVSEEWIPLDIAFGRDGDTIAIKTEWGECVIHGTKAALMDVNSSFVLLDDLSVYSFETGEFLFDAGMEDMNFALPSCSLAKDYIIVRYARDDSNYYRCYVIDKEGNFRYYSEKNWINTTDGPYLFLQRGPYVGLSDLNGDWILKTLDWTLTNDSDVFWRYWA